MKLSNKIMIASICLCLFVISGVIYALFNVKSNSEETPIKKAEQEGRADKVQNNISKPLKSTGEKEKYLLKLEDNKICGYMVLSDGSLTLWNSINLPPTLSAEQTEELKKGITTDSFEKLCLYFESYAS